MNVPLQVNQNIDIDMYNYNDLDNLFDGFFDLSMPTMFQDPLFEGAEYDQFTFNFLTGGASGGPGGAASVDMSYVQQAQSRGYGKGNMSNQRGGNGWRNMGMNMNVDTNEVSQKV